MTRYGKHFSTKVTPQNQPIPGKAQVQNSTGGYVFDIGDEGRLERFLILGSESNTYYASAQKLTVENAEAVLRCLKNDGLKTVKTIVEVSDSGRAPKNDPAIFALALCAKHGDDVTRKAAYEALPKVCRIPTHLFHFVQAVEDVSVKNGWGRGMRNAIANWYGNKPLDKIAMQSIKYQSRDGWSNRDLIRLAHAKAPTEGHNQLYKWIVNGEIDADMPDELRIVEAFQMIQHVPTVDDVVNIITDYKLPRECVPTQWLNVPQVWEALLDHMLPEAMVRNLATMTRVGLVAPLSKATNKIVGVLNDEERLQKARLHPIAVLSALKTYQSGHGVRSQHTWTPVTQITDALNDAFYKTFKFVTPANKRFLLGLDISGSMGCGEIAGVPGLTPRVASAALSLVTAATEKQSAFVAFTSSGGYYGYGRDFQGNPDSGITQLNISPKQRLDTVVQAVSSLPMGGTDCALPILWAMKHNIEVDAFVTYTDSETYAGTIHVSQALEQYRQKTGIDTKMVAVGMTATKYSVCDPDDKNSMNVVGFDTSAPNLISDFCRK